MVAAAAVLHARYLEVNFLHANLGAFGILYLVFGGESLSKGGREDQGSIRIHPWSYSQRDPRDYPNFQSTNTLSLFHHPNLGAS